MRPLRLDFPGAHHHVMNRGARRQNVFYDARSRRLFLDLVSELPDRFGLRIHGYALMPNHFHLMVESNGALAAGMQHLTSRYVQIINSREGWDGPLFRGRYRNKVVATDAHWAHLLLYLHLNPDRAGFQDRMHWTSHSSYCRDAPPWLCTSQLLELHGGVDGYRSALHDAMGGSGAPSDFDADRLWGPNDTGSLRAPLIEGQYTAVRALADVAAVTGRTSSEILESRPGRRGNPTRWLLTWWMRRRRLRHREIGGLVGVSRSGAIRMYLRVEDRKHRDPDLRRWVAALESRAVSVGLDPIGPTSAAS